VSVGVTPGFGALVVRYLAVPGLDARAIASQGLGDNDETPAVADETAIA
jgi:hypothetical protein